MTYLLQPRRIILLSMIALLPLLSCEKESEATQTGTIKVSVSLDVNTWEETCVKSSDIKVNLLKNGEVVGTQNYNDNTLDFGEFDYGNYRVEAFCKITCWKTANMSNVRDENISAQHDFTVDKSTNSVSLTLKN